MRAPHLVAAVLLTGLVSACGGGGEDGNGDQDDVAASRAPSGGEGPARSDKAATDDPLDLWRRDARRRNTGSYVVEIPAGDLRLRAEARYSIAPSVSDGVITPYDQAQQALASVAFRSTDGGSWFSPRSETLDMGDCWFRTDSPAEVDQYGFGLTTAALPPALDVLLRAETIERDDDQLSATSPLGVVVGATGTRLPRDLGIAPDDATPVPVTVQTEDGIITGWSANLAEVVRAATTAGVDLGEVPPSSLSSFAITVEVIPDGRSFSAPRPPPAKVLTLDAPLEGVVDEIDACRAG